MEGGRSPCAVSADGLPRCMKLQYETGEEYDPQVLYFGEKQIKKVQAEIDRVKKQVLTSPLRLPSHLFSFWPLCGTRILGTIILTLAVCTHKINPALPVIARCSFVSRTATCTASWRPCNMAWPIDREILLQRQCTKGTDTHLAAYSNTVPKY